MFGTALNYVALRLLGVPADDPVCIKARETLHKLGRIFSIRHVIFNDYRWRHWYSCMGQILVECLERLLLGWRESDSS